MSTPEKKPSFLYRVGIARLIVFSIIFIVVIIGTYCIKPDQVQAPSQPEELPFGNGHLKLGIIPVFTEGDTTEPDWQKGAVLDAYTDRVAFFAATRAVLLRPSVDIVLPHLNAKGCISPITSTTDPNPSKELIQAKAQLIDIEKVNALITIPCPTTAEHLEQGKEEIWQTLHRLFRLRNAGGFSGEVKGTYTFSGEETLLEQRLIELGGNKERQISTISTTEINNCSSLIVSGVSTENTQLCASSLQPCSPEQMAYEECFYNRWPDRKREIRNPEGQPMQPSSGEITEWTKENIEKQIDQRNYCEVDEDCEAFYAECPFGCSQAVNKQFVQPAQQLINTRRANEQAKGNPQCVYSCVQLLGVQCKEQKCITRTPLPKSHPAAVDEADLEWFRERPDDTMAELQNRKETVEQRINGEYPDCQLTTNGKFVVCT